MSQRENLNFDLETLEERMMLSTVDVYAAGATNQETIELQIDGQTVQVWDNIGGDAYAGQFQKFTFETNEDVDPSQIRIAFTNDLNEGGIDRNVRIDKIVVDGETIETESANVFSTGTWKVEDGVQPGFRLSEYLHADGYFQFAAGSGGGGQVNGSTVDIVVRGDEGTERFNLLINGTVVGTYNVTTQFQTIRYTHNGSVSADDVRIEFINDEWDPQRGVDANLTVDRIVIDGQAFETENSAVFSTGSWLPGDGTQPGFGRSDTLNSNGYFQYSSSGGGNGGGGTVQGSTIEIRVQGDEGTERFELLIKGQVVQTYGVGTQAQTITYTHNESFTANDVRIRFINDEFDPSLGIDSNLTVDFIKVDGQTFQTEDASVFSTGSWLPADGVTPGFGRSETLNSNGFFQYASTTNPGPTNQAPVARKDYFTVEQGQVHQR